MESLILDFLKCIPVTEMRCQLQKQNIPWYKHQSTIIVVRNLEYGIRYGIRCIDKAVTESFVVFVMTELT